MGRRMEAETVSIAALAYASAVVMVAARAPDKGFLASSGRRVVDGSPGGPAERAGLVRGDVIVAIDGEPIRSALHYATRIRQARSGDTVILTVERAGAAAPLAVAITLE